MILDFIDLSNWKKKPQILKELKENGYPIKDRDFRKRVELHNKLYEEHIVNTFIAHSCKGYIATTDKNIIIASLRDNEKRAITMLKATSKTLKALGENANYNFEI